MPTAPRVLALATLALAGARSAEAVCVAPAQSVQVGAQQRIEGEVKATVLNVGAGVQGEKEASQTWAAALPSQDGIDNQWYLYNLCREYESGRLPRAQYCAIQAALWSRITGLPVSPDACLTETAAVATSPEPAPPAALTPAPTTLPDAPPTRAATGMSLSNHASSRSPNTTGAGSPAPAASGTGGRFSAHIPGKRSADLYGPYRIGGAPTWYFDNLSNCLSMLTVKGGRWVEEVVAGPRCSAWSELDVRHEGALVRVTGGGEVFEATLTEPGTTAELQGDWRGRIYPVNDIVRRESGLKGMLGEMGLAELDRIATMDVDLRLLDAGGTTRNDTAGCAGTLARGASGPGWVQFVESVTEGSCPTGAQVTVFALSPGSLLYTWESPNGTIYDGKGILHAVE